MIDIETVRVALDEILSSLLSHEQCSYGATATLFGDTRPAKALIDLIMLINPR